MRARLWIPAALLVLCALSLGLWLGAPDTDVGAAPPTPVAVPSSREADDAPRPVIHLAVLNGTERRDLAGETALLLGADDCVVDRVGNAPHTRFVRSLLVNRRLTDARAARLAERLGGVPVIRERDPRAVEDAVLVLGADHPGLAESLRRAKRP